MKMILIIASIILLFKPVFPVVDYVVNYDFIAIELCVNKATPELHCNGKCYLIKQLAKSSDTDSTNKKVVLSNYELLYFQEIEHITFTFFKSHFNTEVENSYTNNYYHLSVKGIFHPPLV